MSDLISKIKAEVNAHLERARINSERFNNALALKNNGNAPTIDSMGRPHAPSDGYIYDGREYNGGEYLHVPDSIREFLSHHLGVRLSANPDKYLYNVKIIGSVGDLPEIQSILTGHGSVRSGTTFDNDKCNFFFSVQRKTMFDVLDSYRKKQELEKKVLKGKSPAGKAHVKGKLLNIKPVIDHYGSETLKAFIELDNKSTCYGTLPKSINNAVIGESVSFSATFTQAVDDETHAFYKRPSKATITQEVCRGKS